MIYSIIIFNNRIELILKPKIYKYISPSPKNKMMQYLLYIKRQKADVFSRDIRMWLVKTLIPLLIAISSVRPENETDLYYITNYLSNFGYINNVDELSVLNESSLSSYLTIFQEYFGLPNDGKLNNETLNLIKKPRCGNKDLGEFRATSRWNKRILSWDFMSPIKNIIELTTEAFHIWEKHSALKFYRDQQKPDILISFRWSHHRCIKNSSSFCDKNFDGRGGVLGHAFYPLPHRAHVEIHLDFEEKWYYNNDSNLAGDEISLLSVLTHEIGHALGLGHSSDNTSIMFPFYILNNGQNIDLGKDDVHGIQRLYGLPPSLPPPSPVPSVTPTTKATTSSTTVKPPLHKKTEIDSQFDICKVNGSHLFLVINNHLYILQNKLFWMFNIREKSYGKSQNITKWLKFLPPNFANISAMYQRPSGEVVIFVDNNIYMFDIKSLRLVNNFPVSTTSIGFDSTTKINGAVNTYTGRTFIFYNDEYYIELDECSFSVKKHGYTYDDFPGVPKNIDSVFRFIDGFLYFFKDGYVYKYNEFKNVVEQTEKYDLNLFGINCVSNRLIYKLVELLKSFTK